MSNPYNAPAADLSLGGETGATYDPDMVAIHGRIGRFRYIVYSFVLTILAALAVGVVVGILGAISAKLLLVGFLLFIPLFGIMFVVARRRLNDMDRSGWWSVLLLVPLVGLILTIILWAFPGDKQANSFGLPPSENTTGVKIGAYILIGISVLSIVVAIFMVPTYMAMIEAAKSAQSSSMPAIPDASE